ncbi:hypothetical protein V491_00272 [Pseudogymnoascus sp. VKM F-3775]|nr:hypothetical protein V491_00272 [Pseudogymnoascus sp. VKM F-3775]
MPGGRPRKYPNKAAAKAADRLRAVERRAAATKALREGHAVGGKADGGSDGGYRFILEDSAFGRVNGQQIARPHATVNQSPSPVEAPSPSLPALSPSLADVNGLDIPSLDAFGKLTLESTTEVISDGEGHDLDRQEVWNSTKNTGNLDNAHSDDDYSNRLSDVFIDFSGDFGDDFHSRTGEVDDGEASIINGELSPVLSSGTISDNASSSPPTPSQPEAHVSQSAQHLIDQLTYPHTCSREHHALLLQNHLHRIRNHRYTNSECSSVDDLQQLVDPTLPHNSYIPDVLSRNDIKIADRYTCFDSRPAEPLILSDERMQDCRFRKLFEGRESDSTQPQNVCLHLHTSSRLARPPTRAVDIDSASSQSAKYEP